MWNCTTAKFKDSGYRHCDSLIFLWYGNIIVTIIVWRILCKEWGPKIVRRVSPRIVKSSVFATIVYFSCLYFKYAFIMMNDDITEVLHRISGVEKKRHSFFILSFSSLVGFLVVFNRNRFPFHLPKRKFFSTPNGNRFLVIHISVQSCDSNYRSLKLAYNLTVELYLTLFPYINNTVHPT